MSAITSAMFKSLVRTGEATAGLTVRKDVGATAEVVADRRVRFTISTASVDREGDSIALNGWKLDAFQKNPVALWGHDHASPIGKVVELAIEGGALKATVEFLPADVPVFGPLAEAVYRMCCSGFLNATSVGFRPVAWEMSEDPERSKPGFAPGVDFREHELLELSIVSVPCNPDALIEPAPASQNPAEAPAADADGKASTDVNAKHRRARRVRLLTLGK